MRLQRARAARRTPPQRPRPLALKRAEEIEASELGNISVDPPRAHRVIAAFTSPTRGYRSTLSVMLPESGQPETPPFDRDFLARELRIRENDNSKKVPLLYTLLSNAQKNK